MGTLGVATLDTKVDPKGLKQGLRQSRQITESGFKRIGASVSKVLKGMQAGMAAAVGAGLVFKKAFDFSREGAAFIQTGESFGLLLDKIGLAPDLLDQLTKASGGTLTQLQMMSSTATLLAGAQGELGIALGTATPELLKIARAAQKLNPSLGDTTFLYQSLARGIKRASPLILDNTGLVIKVGEANERFAAKIGKTVEQLTAQEEKMALLEETLRAGQVLIDQVGGSVDSMTDDWDRLGTKIGDGTDKVKAWLAEGLRPYLEIMSGGGLNINDALQEHFENLTKTTDSLEEYNAEVLLAAKRAMRYDESTQQLTHDTQELADAAWYAWRETVHLTAAMDDRNWETEKLVRTQADLTEATEDDRLKQVEWGPILEKNAAIREQMTADAEAALRAEQLLNDEMARAARLSGEYFDEAIKAEEITDDWAQQLYDAALAAEADADELAILAGAVGLYDEAQLTAALNAALLKKKIVELAEKYADGAISIGDAKLALWAFKDAMDDIPATKTVTIKTRYETMGQLPGGGGVQRQAGAWKIPRNELAFLHAGEMVIPAPQAEQVRQGGGFNVETLNFNSYSSAPAGATRQDFELMMAVARVG